MRRVLMLTVVLLVAWAGVGLGADSRVYDTTIEVTWEHAIKAIRDVDFVLLDSWRADYRFTMRTRHKVTSKRSIVLAVALSGRGQTTTVRIAAEDASKAKRATKHIAAYLAALDKRLRR
jgi:hypothetical protein